MKYLFIITLFLFSSLACQAQVIDSSATDTIAPASIKNTILPIVFFLPETGLAFGVTGITTFRFKGESVESRPSQVIYSAAYTLKNQFLFYIPFELYRTNGRERYMGEIGFYKYFYNFYGLGNQSRMENLENYNVLFPRIDFSYARSDIDNIYAGIGFKYDHFDITRIDSAGILDNTIPIGYDGGQKLNLLLSLTYDSRNNIISSSSGIFAEIIYQRSLPFLVSDFEYHKYIVDIRSYITLGDQVVLASQLHASSATDSAPFFDLPYIGTPNIARGYSDRRYINRHIMSLQTELRFPITGRFSGASFVSSSVIPDLISRPFDGNQRWSYGAGIRYEFDRIEKTRFRLDIAYGDTLNFYLTANEAF